MVLGDPPPLTVELKPGLVIEGYRLVARLGEGGMAAVWQAEDVDGQNYAPKFLSLDQAGPDGEQHFRQEVDTLKRLYARAQCPYLVGPVERFVSTEFRLMFMRMPVLDGTLGDFTKVRRDGGEPPSEAEILRWAEQALQALIVIHADNTVHRDVKPSNLLMRGQDVVLADLGIVRVAGGMFTKTQDRMGSEPYKSPEQARSPKEVTGKSDVFGLAMTLHEVFAGQLGLIAGKGVDDALGQLLRVMGRLIRTSGSMRPRHWRGCGGCALIRLGRRCRCRGKPLRP